MLFLDIETYCSIDLKKSNVYVYVEQPDFEILMCAWSLNGEDVQIAVGEEQINFIPGLFDPTIPIVAHNAAFERICLSVLGECYGAGHGETADDFFPSERFIDTQALATEAGYPAKLEKLAPALGAEPKDTAGTRLINLFSKPQRGKRIMPEDKPEQWEEFKDYCIQDVRTLIDVYNRLPDMTDTEKQIYLTDQRINDRGIPVDIGMAEMAVAAAEENQQGQIAEVQRITGIENPNSNQQMLAWLQSTGLGVKNMKADTVQKVLDKANLSSDVRRVLELRQELALVASKKYIAALNSTCDDGRFRGGFRFFGAHTGRWSGNRIQLQNLPRQSVENEDMAILDLMLGNGADAQTLKGLVRPLFVGPFTVVDYNAIEARVLAWLAGEQWVLDAFENGRDIYVETAERMGGLTRFQGKVAVLALGYAGGKNSLRVMGAEGNDSQMQMLVDQYRRANPRIVQFWKKMENSVSDGGRVGKHINAVRDGKDLRLELPSGRAIHYHNMQWERYSVQDPETGKWVSKQGWRYDDPKGLRMGTYGGRLSENVTQAVARDILAEALVRLEDAGYEVALHIHDEIGVYGGHPVEDIVKIMCDSPEWAAGLPIDAEGFVCQRYQKG